MIDAIFPYDQEQSDGYLYIFPELGLSFWRDINLTDEDMEENWFQEKTAENQEDTAKHLYFGAVGMFRVNKVTTL